MITEVRTLLDRKQNKMAFVTIEDFSKTYEAVVFASVFPKVEDRIHQGAMVLLRGKLNSDLDEPVLKIICEEAYSLDEVPNALTRSILLRIDKSKLKSNDITYIKNILYAHPGNLPIFFKVSINGDEEINMVSRKVKISANVALINELEKILNINNIRVEVKDQ